LLVPLSFESGLKQQLICAFRPETPERTMAASSVSSAPPEPKILNRWVQMCAANHPDDGYREPAIRLDAVY
jgi:hypothetical protein